MVLLSEKSRRAIIFTPFKNGVSRSAAPIMRALPTTNHVGIALLRIAGVPLNYIHWASTSSAEQQ